MTLGALCLVELMISSHLPFQRQLTNDRRRNLPHAHMIYTKSPMIPSFYPRKVGRFVGYYWQDKGSFEPALSSVAAAHHLLNEDRCKRKEYSE